MLWRLKERVTIALDGMGGDNAPDVVVEGAVLAVRELGVRILLVGKRGRPGAAPRPPRGSPAASRSCTPARSSRWPSTRRTPCARRPTRRWWSAVRQVKEGRAGAFVSAGNTGAVMAAGLFGLRRIPGVDRPALAAAFPTRRGATLVARRRRQCRLQARLPRPVRADGLDLRRAGLRHRPPNGRVALERRGGREGQRPGAGGAPELRELPINFVGNVEGKDIPSGKVDVVVCDGFTGNVVLKLSEGLASAITGAIREEINASLVSKLFAVGVLPAFRPRAQAAELRRVWRCAAARAERHLHHGARPLERAGDQERRPRGGARPSSRTSLARSPAASQRGGTDSPTGKLATPTLLQGPAHRGRPSAPAAGATARAGRGGNLFAIRKSRGVTDDGQPCNRCACQNADDRSVAPADALRASTSSIPTMLHALARACTRRERA